jgi:hypothetical protein
MEDFFWSESIQSGDKAEPRLRILLMSFLIFGLHNILAEHYIM